MAQSYVNNQWQHKLECFCHLVQKLKIEEFTPEECQELAKLVAFLDKCFLHDTEYLVDVQKELSLWIKWHKLGKKNLELKGKLST